MALLNVNGKGVVSGTILMPRNGAWTADLIVDSQEAITGAVTIAIDQGPTLVGTVTRGDVYNDTLYLRATAGADGLRKLAQPKHYKTTTLRAVLLDLLRKAGEALDSTADASTLGLSLPAWTVIQQPTGLAISALMGDARLAGRTWRMLENGRVWVGREAWPESPLKNAIDYQELARLPHEGRSELGFQAPSLLPGTSLGGRHVSYVEHSVKDDCVRTFAWFEDV